MKLCCIFNYAPDYRTDIYKKIDQTFDTVFYFGREVEEGKISGIPKIDYKIFKNRPIEIKNKTYLKGYIWWRSGLFTLPFRNFNFFLITGDIPYSYFPFLILCKLLRKKVYAWGHGFKQFKSGGGKLAYLFLKLLTGFFTYGDRGRQRLVELGVNNKKLFTIYNSLGGRESLKKLKNPIYKNKFRNSNPTVIFIGRLTKVKRLDWILRASTEHKTEGLNYNVIFIGDGPVKEELKELCNSLAIAEQVWFFGECHDENIYSSLIYNSDLCVSPGNVGLTAINCMRFGTPVLSHDNFGSQGPEYETIVPGITGELYKEGDFDDFKDKIKKWLNSNADRELIRQKCVEMINGCWNSDFQIELLKKVFYSANE